MNNEEVVVSTGVRFGIRDVPVVMLRNMQRQMERERPRAPVLYIAEKEREEENPNDPDYLEAVKKWDEDSEVKLLEFALMTGTKVLEVPDNIPSLDSEGWVEECKYFDIDIPVNGGIRYMKWLEYIACPDPNDMNKLVLAAVRQLGATEADVADATAMFQNRAQRRANPKPPSKAHSRQRD